MSQHDDDSLERYLAGDSELSALYRQSRNAEDEPNAVMDPALLQAARDAVVAPAPPVRLAPRPRWYLPVSVAATLVVASSLYLVYPPDSDTRTSSITQKAAPSPARTMQDAEPADATLSTDALTESYSAPAPAPSSAGAVPPSAPRAKAASKAEIQTNPQAQPAQPERSDPAPVLRSAPSQQPLPRAAHSPPPAAAVLSDQALLPEQRQREPLEKALRSAPATMGSLSAEAGSAANALDNALDDSAEQAFRRTPESWLAHIDALLGRGEQRAAALELELFLSQHPAYPLPETLSSLRPGDAPPSP